MVQMSEQNGNEVVETEESVVAEQESVVEETPVEAEQRIPISRLNEVIAQREAAAAERERLAYENQALRQQLQSQPRQQVAPAAEALPWEQYTDPNTRALAKLSYDMQLAASKQSNAAIEQRLQKAEAIWEQQEANSFWARYPQVPAELKAKTETIYSQAKNMGVDRDTALTFAYGEAQRANLTGQVTSAQASVAQQSAVNRAARPSISNGTANTTPQPKARSAADLMAKIEAEHAKLLKG